MASYKNLFWQNLVLTHEVRNISVNSIDDMLSLYRIPAGSKVEISNGPRTGDIFHIVNDWPFGQDNQQVFQLFNGGHAVLTSRIFYKESDIATDIRPAEMFNLGEVLIVRETGVHYRVVAEGQEFTTAGGTKLVKVIRNDILPAATVEEALEGEMNHVSITPYTLSRTAARYTDSSKAWAESTTSPDGTPGSKSAKTWATEAQTLVTGLVPGINATAYSVPNEEPPVATWNPDNLNFDFAIPAGPRGFTGYTGSQGIQGPAGTGVSIIGSLVSDNDLPVSAEPGDAYLIDGDLWVWDGEAWNNAGTIKGPQGDPGPQGQAAQEVEFRTSGGFVQWRYIDGTWQNLIATSDLRGVQGYTGSQGNAGRETELRSSGGFIQWRYVGDSTWQNIVPYSAITGPRGDTGKEVELRVFGGYVEWRHEGDSVWNRLLALEDIQGASVELQANATHIRWRHIGSTGAWANIVALADLRGYTGSTGYTGSGVELRTASGNLEWKPTGTSSWNQLIDLTEIAEATSQEQYVVNMANGQSLVSPDTLGRTVVAQNGIASVAVQGGSQLIPDIDYTVAPNGMISLAAPSTGARLVVETMSRVVSPTVAQSMLDNYRLAVASTLNDKVEDAEDARDAAQAAAGIATNAAGPLIGGAAGHILRKKSGTNYDYEWTSIVNAGAMAISTYDPSGMLADAFSMENMKDGVTKLAMTPAERTHVAGSLRFDTTQPLTATQQRQARSNIDTKRITISSSAPSGGEDGDVWLQY